MRTRYEDTFVDIARTYGLGYDELVAANPGVDPWIPGADTPIVLPTRYVLPQAPREGLVLNIASKRLFYFPPMADGEPQIVETYPIGIGREGWATPTGSTTVASKARDPVWFVPASVRREHLEAGDPLPRQVPPGPDNPLGNYVLGLGLPGYLIHGTNKPAGVGMRVSHGCVRLFPENIESLFERVEIGTPVRIVNQPYLLARVGDDLVFEAHEPLEDDERDWGSSVEPMARAKMVGLAEEVMSLDSERLGLIAGDARGFPVSVISWRPDTDTTVHAARPVINIIPREPADEQQLADQSVADQKLAEESIVDTTLN
ncbi:MAG: L,D-transpeptidase family protein [Gammaproteobacteria bacterium]|nr:L,D-transpeptidase family protein [Gammaproteobacteria bacterium]NND36411.1 L,D-transpeptidase family protein [Gammaproteobacteria bacterium]